MKGILFLTCLVSVLGSAFSNDFVIENDQVLFKFDPASGFLTDLLDKRTKVNTVGKAAGSVQMIDLLFVNSNGQLKLGELSNVVGEFSNSKSSSSLRLTWPNTSISQGSEVVAHTNITLQVDLKNSDSVADWKVSFSVIDSSSPIGLWDVSVSVPSVIGSAEDGELFYPAGFGYIYTNPIKSTGGMHAKTYPGGEASMQFLALGSDRDGTGVYMAAKDPAGSAKLLQFSSKAGKMRTNKATWRKEEVTTRDLSWSSLAHSSASVLSIVMYPGNAGVPLAVGDLWSAPYSIAVGVVPHVSAAKSRPLWSEASSIYRDWALQEAAWTREGPISDLRRADQFPTWFTSNNVWLNTHWQCHDIFNATGGDPQFVLPNTIAVADRLGQEALALHWYEWQQGPDPSPEARYLFDTHYPDYFPARTAFKSAVEGLAARNITTFPYINGRISDINSNAYLTENGEQFCTKKAPTALVDPKSPPILQSYVETYGSNASFCVTNPYTAYWQNKLADTVEQLVAEDDVAGVYIDQIGSAVPKLCWDASHHHKLGGGDYWTVGYKGMMDTIDQRLKGRSRRPMVTEDNAEPYMGMVQGFLTLNAYKAWYSDDGATSSPKVVAAFPMVYGGYYVGFGAIWSRADFGDHDWWRTKLAAMFTTGSQLGWFSIAGIENDPSDGCGPMGVGDLLMSESNDDLVAYLKTLSQTRTQYIDYFVHGHVVRPVVLSPKPSKQTFTSEFDNSQQEYETLQVQSWGSEQKASVAVVLATTTQTAYSGELTADLSLWEEVLQLGEGSVQVHVTQWVKGQGVSSPPTSSLSVSAASSKVVTVPVLVPAEGTLVLEFSLRR